MHNPARRVGISPKLSRAWEGPYVIIKRLSDVTYRIQRNPRAKMKVVHFDRLKPYMGKDQESWVVGPPGEPQLTPPGVDCAVEPIPGGEVPHDPDETIVYSPDPMNVLPSVLPGDNADNMCDFQFLCNDSLSDPDETVLYDHDDCQKVPDHITISESDVLSNLTHNEVDSMDDTQPLNNDSSWDLDRTVIYDHSVCNKVPDPEAMNNTDNVLSQKVDPCGPNIQQNVVPGGENGVPQRSSRPTKNQLSSLIILLISLMRPV
jgi:hypothetical protein